MTGSAQRLKRVSRLELRLGGAFDPDELRDVVAAMRATVPRTADAHAPEGLLPERWEALDFHADQARAFHSDARFRTIEAGRRSGKSEGRKREIVIKALDVDWFAQHGLRDRFIVIGAPTQQQAMRLYWRDILSLIPSRFVVEARKTEHEIELVTGALIRVLGMDESRRVEGDPIDDLFLDEYADMKADVWTAHLRASLSSRRRPPGSATFFGTPDMSKGEHFIELCDKAEKPDWKARGWAHFHWSSEGIIDPEEWKSAKEDLPDEAFAVEYRGLRVASGARIYYAFDRHVHRVLGLRVFPDRPLIVCCDWNWNPGTCVIAQEQCVEDYNLDPIHLPDEELDGDFTAVLGEVFIKRGNTPKVMRRLLEWIGERGHKGQVHVYGDASGGAEGSAKVQGSDIELTRKTLGPVLGDRLSMRFPARNPFVKARTNSLNLRLRAANEAVRMLVDALGAPELVKDFEKVIALEGSAGEIDKKRDAMRSHLSDGLGYYTAACFPAAERVAVSSRART